MDYGINVKMKLFSNMDIRGLEHWEFLRALVCGKDWVLKRQPWTYSATTSYMALAWLSIKVLVVCGISPKGAGGAPIGLFSACQGGALWFLGRFVSHPLGDRSYFLMEKP